MFTSSTEAVVIFVIVCTLLIALLIGFVTYTINRYQQKQNAYFKGLEELKIAHSNELLQSQLKIQEQTFENISREIHDNIGQKLTLAKLHLNTLDLDDENSTAIRLKDSISMISEAINDLSDISRSMSSEIILNNGLIEGLEFEVALLNKSCLYNITLSVKGNVVFLESQKELLLFRIVQEALNNIVKHANASIILIELFFDESRLLLQISDNGKGFLNNLNAKSGTGIANMKRRSNLLDGNFCIESHMGKGTEIKINIPLYESQKINQSHPC